MNRLTFELAEEICKMCLSPKYEKTFNYLLNYKFTGFSNHKGETFNQIIESYQGWYDFLSTEILWRDIPESRTVEDLAVYVLNRLTCLIAIDMFCAKYTADVFELYTWGTNNCAISMTGSNLFPNEVSSGVKIFFDTSIARPEYPLEAYLLFQQDDYVATTKALDTKLDVHVHMKNTATYRITPIKVCELNKDRLLEMFIRAGW